MIYESPDDRESRRQACLRAALRLQRERIRDAQEAQGLGASRDSGPQDALGLGASRERVGPAILWAALAISAWALVIHRLAGLVGLR